MKKKKKLPDFGKMSLPEIDRWGEKNDLTDYLHQLRVVYPDELVRDQRESMLNVRLPRWLKRKLADAAQSHGLRGASSMLRVLAVQHFDNGRSKAA